MHRPLIGFVLLTILSLLAACSSHQEDTDSARFVRPGAQVAPVRQTRLAVPPFLMPDTRSMRSPANAPDAGPFLAETLAAQLTGRATMAVADPSVTRRRMQRFGLTPEDLVTTADLARLRAYLGADVVALGKAAAFSEREGVALEARFLDLRTGEVLGSLRCLRGSQGTAPEETGADLLADGVDQMLGDTLFLSFSTDCETSVVRAAFLGEE